MMKSLVVVVCRARTRGGIYKDRKFYTAKQCRKLSIRHRGPGPYKIILKSSDITYDNGATPENTKRVSLSSSLVPNFVNCNYLIKKLALLINVRF